MVHDLSQASSAIPDAGWRDLLAWVFRRRSRLRVAGPSMKPTLEPGDVVLVNPRAPVAENDIVCARHPHQPTLKIVKRVKFVDERGRPYLMSDNLEATDSADSRSFGTVPSDTLVGRITARLPR